MRQQDRFSRQPPSEPTLPSGIFGLIEEPGTINQTDKHAVRVAAGGDVPVQGGAHKSEMSPWASCAGWRVWRRADGWMDDGTALRGRRFSHMAL